MSNRMQLGSAILFFSYFSKIVQFGIKHFSKNFIFKSLILVIKCKLCKNDNNVQICKIHLHYKNTHELTQAKCPLCVKTGFLTIESLASHIKIKHPQTSELTQNISNYRNDNTSPTAFRNIPDIDFSDDNENTANIDDADQNIENNISSEFFQELQNKNQNATNDGKQLIFFC